MPPLRVLHADQQVLAVDKPPGMLVIPGRGPPERTVQQEASGTHGRVWVVHRLDRWTSGVLLLARTAAAHQALNLCFDRREVTKRYLAIVRGTAPDEVVVDAALAPARRGRMRVARPGEPGAKASSTAARCLERFPPRGAGDGFSLVEALPLTGRTHQIRVHLASAGLPLAVDPDYGSAEPVRDAAGAILLARTPLHASLLEVPHPATGATLRLEAPLPPDLAALLAWLRG